MNRKNIFGLDGGIRQAQFRNFVKWRQGKDSNLYSSPPTLLPSNALPYLLPRCVFSSACSRSNGLNVRRCAPQQTAA